MDRKNLAFAAENYGELAAETIAAELDLANDLAGNGEIEEAIRICESAVSHLRESIGFTSSATLQAVSRLAGFHAEAGNIEEAVLLYCYVYEKKCEAGEAEKKETLQVACDLTELYVRTGKVEEALDLGNRILDPVRNTFGKVNPVTANLINNLKDALREYDRTEKEKESNG